MIGGIYSDERCPLCGSAFRDDHRSGLICPNHPKQRATRFRVNFGKLCKRFKSYENAFSFLNGVRFETDKKTYDERDYRKDNPLAFSIASKKYVRYKGDEVRKGSLKNIRRHIEQAQGYFGETSCKDIKYGHLEDFIKSIKLSDKSRHNIMSTLHDFFSWLYRRQEIREMPLFPVIHFELGTRTIIAKPIQLEILSEIERIAPYKVWLGIKWLMTYISIRPGELIKLKEGDIDLDNGYLDIPDPKEKKPKTVPILAEDVEVLKSFPKAIPGMPFFRHPSGVSGVHPDEAYGEKYFYKWWIKACANLGIEGVDLYGGTRHSSARALRKHRTPEEIKRATMHSTNKAFERYFALESDDLREIYRDTGTVISMPNVKVMSAENKPNESE